MTEFIHFLATPACILSFDGEIVDVNDLMLKDSKCPTVFDFMNFSAKQLCFDKKKHNKMVDYLLSGGTLVNQKMLLHFFDGTLGTRVTNISILSKEKRLLLVQNYGNYDEIPFYIEKINRAFDEIESLSPFINDKGKDLLRKMSLKWRNDVVFQPEKSDLQKTKDLVKSKCDFLTESELNIASLLSLGYSTKEIENYDGNNANAIRVIIYRINKKFNTNSRKDLIKKLKGL